MDLFFQALNKSVDEAQERMDRITGSLSEAELIAADLAYLERREQRFRDRLAVVHEMELDAMRRAGAL